VGAHVRAIKSRIGNVEDIGQITKAMNAIAMTKVTRLKKRLVEVRPYVDRLEAFAADLIGRIPPDGDLHPLLVDNGSHGVGILVLNSDRGLCGRYKGDINRKGDELHRAAGRDGRIFAGGEKARTFFERREIPPTRIYAHVYDTPSYEAASRIANEMVELYLDGEIGRLVVVYMRFVSDLSQRLVSECLLPLAVEPRLNDSLIEPDVAALLEGTLPLYVRGRLFSMMLETKTSEDAIRRQAMKSATDNAEDLLKTLTRAYNKARQQSITREIADIIGGAEALRVE